MTEAAAALVGGRLEHSSHPSSTGQGLTVLFCFDFFFFLMESSLLILRIVDSHLSCIFGISRQGLVRLLSFPR